MTARQHTHTVRGGLPPLNRLVVPCPMCGIMVRVPVVKEFASVLRRVCALAGVRLARDLPTVAYPCHRGHIVVITLDMLEAAS